jgi:ATP-dependent helicase Lhr and Lhr-like helicase
MLERAEKWAVYKGWIPFQFQREAWISFEKGESGLINAPTGSGKTYSLMIPILLGINPKIGLQAIWITPIKALTHEIAQAGKRAAEELGLIIDIKIRTGDSTAQERTKLKKSPPHILITTPESLHLMLASTGYGVLFNEMFALVIDEWHELLGSKRGVQMELALSRIQSIAPKVRVWAISATIGNLDLSARIVTKPLRIDAPTIIKANIDKKLEVISVLPENHEVFPWAGHLGIRLLHQILPIIEQGKSTLIFTNTRAQCEIWYKSIIESAPHLSGTLAMHHSSLAGEIRDWVEHALHEGTLKAVVCTSSLDLGVDFRPVETIIQIGSPKGINRFIQRAGRSGHQPGAISRIYFVPTHALELMESIALKQAVQSGTVEERIPLIRSFDVLVQYLITLAVSDGFISEKIYSEIKNTYSFESISIQEWNWILRFITTGGDSLQAYEEYKKVILENGIYCIKDKGIALRHRLSIGTIPSDTSLQVKYIGGGWLGTVEEWFISQLKPGDIFWFSGKPLELVQVKEMTALVKKSKSKKGKIPVWMGGNLSLSSHISHILRTQLNRIFEAQTAYPEMAALIPIFKEQIKRSHLPKEDEFLVESFEDKEGYHLLMYPFEGRFVHEGMAALVGFRISKIQPITFSIAMNDYGFELLSDQKIHLTDEIIKEWLSPKNLMDDLMSAVNSTEMAKRKFRDIAAISGLIFRGFPGKTKKEKHLQSSSQLFFDVFLNYEPEHLLVHQAYEEVIQDQLQDLRLRATLNRILAQKMVITYPNKATPFSFPIMVDRIREGMSSEQLEDRIKKMKIQLIKN